MEVLNRKETRGSRKALRQNQTDAERVLWSKLRNKQVNGLKFFRQYGVGRYIADFYCPKIRLAVEVDGGQHYMDEATAYDFIREKMFASLGIRTVRFSNIEVLNELDGVLEKILELTPLTPL